jgi:hypothetical protein
VIVLPAADRVETVQPGIHTWHCFSAGAHYDASNLSFGPLIGVDEHQLEPGAGFDEHAHRGVTIFSFVVEGQLLHHRSGDVDQVIKPGESLRQDASEPIRHVERNFSVTEPLRFIQSTVLADSALELDVYRESFALSAQWAHVYVVNGSWSVAEFALSAGDSLRATEPLDVHGAGTILVLS